MEKPPKKPNPFLYRRTFLIGSKKVKVGMRNTASTNNKTKLYLSKKN